MHGQMDNDGKMEEGRKIGRQDISREVKVHLVYIV